MTISFLNIRVNFSSDVTIRDVCQCDFVILAENKANTLSEQ